MDCPNCNSKIIGAASDFGRFWSCPVCNGRAVTLSVLQKAFPKERIGRLWQAARLAEAGGRSCPACNRKMKIVPAAETATPLYLDVCTGCYFIWFDSSEFEKVAKDGRDPLTQGLSPEAKASLAKAELKMGQEARYAGLPETDAPEHWWEMVLIVFGFPVEYDKTGISQKPIATWALTGLMILLYLATFPHLTLVIQDWGLVPAALTRHFGLTFLTSFLLHSGLFHLASNLYFLLVFGDNVEDEMGWRKYILLILFAALLGDVLHLLADPRSTTPLVGASGGISGIIIYYALKFPKNQVGIFVFFRFFRISVRSMVVFWLVIQVIGTIQQISGFSNISALAHLGGGVVGFLFWFYTREKNNEQVRVEKQRPKSGL